MRGSDRGLETDDLERMVRAAFARRLGSDLVQDLASDENLFQAGICSIDLVAALAQLERELQIEVTQPAPLAVVCASIDSTVDYLYHNTRRAARTDGLAQ